MEGMQDGSIRSDLDPVALSIYIHTPTINALNLDLPSKIVLKARNIPMDRFWDDLELFLEAALRPGSREKV